MSEDDIGNPQGFQEEPVAALTNITPRDVASVVAAHGRLAAGIWRRLCDELGASNRWLVDRIVYHANEILKQNDRECQELKARERERKRLEKVERKKRKQCEREPALEHNSPVAVLHYPDPWRAAS